MWINPDHFLETANGRIWTTERNQAAWSQCYAQLDHCLTQDHYRKIYLLIGCQASGKSTWAKYQIKKEAGIIIFDAILMKKVEREPILAKVKKTQLTCIAVCMPRCLTVCLTRNHLRPLDERVNEIALHNVYQSLEVPNLHEGFDQIITINPE